MPGSRVSLFQPRDYRSKDGQTITVRTATEKDIRTFVGNTNKVAKEGIYIATEEVSSAQKRLFLEGMKNPKHLTIVANYSQGHRSIIIGSLALFTHGNFKKMRHVRFLAMLVVAGYREKGIGSALMDYALSWAVKNKEIEKISLSVFSTNERAINLYKKFGFKVEGKL